MTYLAREKFEGWTASGTALDSWEKVLTILREKTVAGMVKNTGASNDLRFKFSCIHVKAGMEMPVVPETETASEFVLTSGNHKHFTLTIPHWELYINLKNEIAGQDASYLIEFSTTSTPS